MIATEEPILSRLDRLDTILRHLEENRGIHSRSSRSSYASTYSSGNISDGHEVSTDMTPKSLDSYYRSIEDVINETQLKGTLLDRLDHVEDQVMQNVRLLNCVVAYQLCVQLESDLEVDNQRTDEITPHKKKSSLKQLVKSCISPKRNKSSSKT